MAAAPDNGVLQPPGQPPIGAILVRRGLLTEEQLVAALAESQRTGEATGEVIVRLGFASAATIAQALATQHGGPLKTEYGYAVGFGGSAPTTAAVEPPPVSPLPAQDERPAAPAPASAVRAAPPVEPVLSPAPLAPEPDPVLLQWQEHAQKLAAEVAAAKSRSADLERTIEDLASASAGRDGRLDADLAAARDDAAHIRSEKDAGERAYDALISRSADLERRFAESQAAADARAAVLERRLEAAAAQIAQLEAERNDVLAVAKAVGEERRDRHADDHAEDPSHLLFVPGADGYRLLEQGGPPPAVGSTLELAEDDGPSSRLLVAKIGTAPLPGTRLACAYLVAAA